MRGKRLGLGLASGGAADQTEGRSYGGAVQGGGTEFFEAVLRRQFFHDRQPEVGFQRGWILDLAVGFVDADELGHFLELFFGFHKRFNR